MGDRIAIEIGGRELTALTAYSADSHLLIPADEFSVTVPGAAAEFKAGDRFDLRVNGHLEMTGLVEKIERNLSATVDETTLSGRDLMGLAVDECLDKNHWKTKKGTRLKDLAASLLSGLPYLKDQKVVFMHELADAQVSGRKSIVKKNTSMSPLAALVESADEQFAPGTTVFDVLADRAARHGLLLWMAPDGTLVFGRLQGADAPPLFRFCLYEKTPAGYRPAENNVLTAAVIDDLSKRYAKITVVGQREGNDLTPAADHDLYETETDKTFPYSSKRLVIQRECKTPQEAKQLARIEMHKRIASSWRLKLDVAGHSQDGVNYRANEACDAALIRLGINEKLLIIGRRFTYSESEGQKTALELGKLTEGYVVQ